jgi:hypothetical protein
MKKYVAIMSVIFLSVFLGSCTQDAPETTEEPMQHEDGIARLADGTKYIIHPDKIRGGGPPKDGIPSIDHPRYVSVQDADEWIQDDELVLALVYDDVKRVYPLQILVWHEIVNDDINGKRVLITYCPLCGSGIAYKPIITVDGEEKAVEFGTSGKLFNSNLVMYDRETETYWQQIDGKAIVGSLVGQELQEISIDTVVWRDWKVAHSDSNVLSQQTGHVRNYGKDPYGSYYENSFLMFPVENEDTRVHPKTIIFGIEVNDKFVAYRESDLIKEGVIKDTGNEIVKERDMWFVWYAFHPETELYGVEGR